MYVGREEGKVQEEELDSCRAAGERRPEYSGMRVKGRNQSGFSLLRFTDPATGEWLQTFAVITTMANELTGQVHDRMPVILHPRDYDRWLDRGETEQFPIDLLRPYEADAMQAEACNPAVGSVRNNGPELLQHPNPEEPPSLLNSA